MATTSIDLKPYNVCWLKTKAGDQYVGLVNTTIMEKDVLKMSVAPILRIFPSDIQPNWRVLAKTDRCDFTFEKCLIKNKRDGNFIEIESERADTIKLTSNGADNALVEQLIADYANA